MTVLRVLDFETTGLDPATEKVIEVGYSDYNVETRAVSDPVSWLCFADHIPPENRAVHHITLDDIADRSPFDAEAFIAESKIVNVAVIVAHNAEFEIGFLGDPGIPVICTYKAGLRIWPEAPSHANTALAYWLEDKGFIQFDHTKIVPTHRAGPDAYVTAHILKALFEAGATGKQMVAWTKEPKLLPRITFGKHRGTDWKDAPGSYLAWIIGSDMDADTKWNAQREIERRNAQ